MLECKVYAANDLRVLDVPVPEPRAGEVLVRLGAAGICGSDMHYYFHGGVGSFRIREPLTPGHEASGTVATVGSGVTRVKAGDRIAINPSRWCGQCPACREGRENLCVNMRFLGSASVFPHMQGMFREYFVMPERQCVPVTADVSLEELAMSEPLSVARQVGADQVVRSDQLPAQAKLAETIGGEPDVAFEVSGAVPALASALEAVRRGGIIVQVGTLPPEGMHLLANQVMARELDLRGSFRFGNVFDMAVQAIAGRRVDVRPVLSGTHPLTEAAAAITLARDKTRSMKVQLRPRQAEET